MTTQLLPCNAVTEDGWMRRLSERLKFVWVSLAAWVDTSAKYRANAVIYEQLSALSDAELARRGLLRATLAHDVLNSGTSSLRNRRTRNRQT